MLDFDGALLFGGGAGPCFGGTLLGRGLRAGGGRQQAQCHAGTQDGGGACTACALSAWVVQAFVAIVAMHECSMAGRLVGRSAVGILYDAALLFSTPILPCAKLC